MERLRRMLWLAIGAVLALALLAYPASATTDTIGSTGGSNVFGNDILISQKVVASASGTLSTLGLNFQSPTGSGNFVIGIYADTGGTAPTGAPLAQAATAKPLSSGWKDVSVSGISIVSGTSYWLVFETDANDAVYWQEPGAAGKYMLYNYNGVLPAWVSSGNTAYVTNMRMTYGTGTTTTTTSSSTTTTTTPSSTTTTAPGGTTTTLPPTACSIPPGRLATVTFLTSLSRGTHTFRLCTASACQTGYLNIA